MILVTHRLGDLVEHCQARRGDPRRPGPRDPGGRGADRGRASPASSSPTSGAERGRGSARPGQAAAAAGGRLFSVARLDPSRRRVPRHRTFAAQPGEIVALMGVEGSGARELLRSLRRPRAHAAGRSRSTASERRSRAIRRRTRLCAGHPAAQPLLEFLRRRESAGAPRPAGDRRRRHGLAEAADAGAGPGGGRAASWSRRGTINQPIRSLSGGNQQKVAIAQALTAPAATAAAGGADPRRRHPQQGRDLSPAARLRRMRAMRWSCSAPRCWRCSRRPTACSSSPTASSPAR